MKRILQRLAGMLLLAAALFLAPAFLAGMTGADYGQAYAAATTVTANASGPTEAGVALSSAGTPQGAFGQAITQPTNPSQAQATYALGQSCVVVYLSQQSPSTVNANTTVEQDITVTGVAVGSVVAVSKPTTQAGIGIVNARVKSANTVSLTFCNVTAGNITPTASQNYWIVEFRGPLIQSTGVQTFGAVASLTTKETTVTLMPAAGQQGVASGQVAFDPTTYSLLPSVNSIDGSATGTAFSSSQSSPTAVQNAVISNSPQCVILNKPTAQAGLGVANVRVPGNNQIAITHSNTSGAPITPTAEAYSFIALRGIALDGDVVYGVNVGALAAVNTITAAQQTVTVNGLKLATDVVKSVNKPSDQAGIGLCEARVTADNTLGLKFVNPTAGNVTPTASEVYLVSVQKNIVGPNAGVLTQFSATLAAAAVATITGAEQTFAMPGLISGAPLAGLNIATGPGYGTSLGGALAPGLIVGGVRASANDTLAVNLLNVTGASISPGTLQATVLQGQSDSSGSATAAAGSFVAWPMQPQQVQLTELANAMQAVLAKLGLMKGA